jgi:prepilin-type N-terminal cleavage/methylation domain-containing protein
MGATGSRRRMVRSFTLVELMTVVAIIGILASIAMPLVYQNQLKAKKSEIVLNLDGLADAAIAYSTMFDTFGTSSVDFQPGPYFDKAAHPWDDGSIPQVFIDLGWMPDGDVRASYFYDTDDATYVYIEAQADMDDDGDNYHVRDSIDPVTGDRLSPDLEECVTSGNSPIECY